MSTALPSIIHDLNGTDSFVWVSSAYNLACTAVLPLSGRLADIFGRQEVLLVSILIFAAGSAVTAAAQSMNMLIAGRGKCSALRQNLFADHFLAVQGFGGGACLSITEIIYADLVPLPERGNFQGIIAA